MSSTINSQRRAVTLLRGLAVREGTIDLLTGLLGYSRSDVEVRILGRTHAGDAAAL